MSAAFAGGVRIAAPAKVNLYLHVLGRRADGLHLLDSLVVFVGIADSLSARPARDLTLAIDGPFADRLDAAEDNLVLRAARRLRSLGGDGGAAIRLTKHLPVAAGIGGGSADAAAALKALSGLWGLAPAPAQLAAMAAELGADVPVCLSCAPAFVGGIGEAIEPAPALPPAHLVLVNPGRALPTAAVFEARTGDYSGPGRWRAPPRDAAALADRLRPLGNGLADAAIGLMPEIAEVLRALGAAPACLLARMSGSGATCFGLFVTREDAEAAASGIAARHPGWWVAPAPLLARAPDVEIL